MSLTVDIPDLDGCVKARIHAPLHIKGCFVGMAHGWAVSLPGGTQLDRVFLVGEEVGPDLEESVGPELDEGVRHDALEHAYAAALWAEARKTTTSVALVEAHEALEGRDTDPGATRADHHRAFYHEASV